MIYPVFYLFIMLCPGMGEMGCSIAPLPAPPFTTAELCQTGMEAIRRFNPGIHPFCVPYYLDPNQGR